MTMKTTNSTHRLAASEADQLRWYYRGVALRITLIAAAVLVVITWVATEGCSG